MNSLENTDSKKNNQVGKIKEQSALPEKNPITIINQTSEKLKELNSDKNQKDTILDTSVRDYSMADNDEFDNLFNDDEKKDLNFESNALNIFEIENNNNNNLAHENQIIFNNNNNENKEQKNVDEFSELKTKNSMKIKLNFDLNTVELNSKFVEINQDIQMNEEYDEEDEPNYFDENEEIYENEDDNQGENMEIDDNYYDGYEEDNEPNCVLREKSTIITIPNLNFLSEQNFDDNEKPRSEHAFIDDKNKNQNNNLKNLERVAKIGNSNDNQKDPYSNCINFIKWIFLEFTIFCGFCF